MTIIEQLQEKLSDITAFCVSIDVSCDLVCRCGRHNLSDFKIHCHRQRQKG